MILIVFFLKFRLFHWFHSSHQAFLIRRMARVKSVRLKDPSGLSLLDKWVRETMIEWKLERLRFDGSMIQAPRK